MFKNTSNPQQAEKIPESHRHKAVKRSHDATESTALNMCDETHRKVRELEAQVSALTFAWSDAISKIAECSQRIGGLEEKINNITEESSELSREYRSWRDAIDGRLRNDSKLKRPRVDDEVLYLTTDSQSTFSLPSGTIFHAIKPQTTSRPNSSTHKSPQPSYELAESTSHEYFKTGSEIVKVLLS